MNDQPPSDEAVKAAFAYVDADTMAPSDCIMAARILAPFREHVEPLGDTAARILAAHARALSLKATGYGQENTKLRAVLTGIGQIVVDPCFDASEATPEFLCRMIGTVQNRESEVERLRAALEASLIRWEVRDCRCNPDRRGTICHRCASIKEHRDALAGKGEGS